MCQVKITHSASSLLPFSLGFAVVARSGHLIGAMNIFTHSASSVKPISIGFAVVARSGHIIGAMKYINEFNHFKTFVYTSLVIAVFISCLSALFTFIFRNHIASLYTSNVEVIEIATSLLLFACIYQIVDGIQVVSASVLRGMKITKPTFYIAFIAYWPIGFGIGYVLSFTDFIVPAMGVSGFWIGIILGLTSASIMLFITLRKELTKFNKLFL